MLINGVAGVVEIVKIPSKILDSVLTCRYSRLHIGDDRVKRLTANDIIGHFLKHKELKDLGERIERIEERLETSI